MFSDKFPIECASERTYWLILEFCEDIDSNLPNILRSSYDNIYLRIIVRQRYDNCKTNHRQYHNWRTYDRLAIDLMIM